MDPASRMLNTTFCYSLHLTFDETSYRGGCKSDSGIILLRISAVKLTSRFERTLRANCFKLMETVRTWRTKLLDPSNTDYPFCGSFDHTCVGNNRTQLFVDDEYNSRLASAVLAPCKRVSNSTKNSGS